MNIKNLIGQNPVHIVCKRGHVELLRIFIE